MPYDTTTVSIAWNDTSAGCDHPTEAAPPIAPLYALSEVEALKRCALKMPVAKPPARSDADSIYVTEG
ncbi:MAG: hypothetical protein JW795_09975 [Chitinivibrionales bacterium]|nr:hypothetical protein [Chitinivibrionales bacterium]